MGERRNYRVYIRPIEKGEKLKMVYFVNLEGAIICYKHYKARLYQGGNRVVIHEREGKGWRRVAWQSIYGRKIRAGYAERNLVEIRA